VFSIELVGNNNPEPNPLGPPWRTHRNLERVSNFQQCCLVMLDLWTGSEGGEDALASNLAEKAVLQSPPIWKDATTHPDATDDHRVLRVFVR
jgi:hypothetical protein